MNKGVLYGIILSVLIVILFFLNLFIGSVSIPMDNVIKIVLGQYVEKDSWRYIVINSRLPQAITALLCGGALSVSGLMLQTIFKNPLADPSILGISSGSSLGVAIVMLLIGGNITLGTLNIGGFIAMFISAFIGAIIVISILFFFSNIIRNNVILLIIGIMISFLSSSIISLLNFFASEESVKNYVIWGMGSFSGISLDFILPFSVLILTGIVVSILLIKPLNILLLGELYAENLGINTLNIRNILIIVTGLLTAITTAFCGPISFIGLAVPHISRLFLSTENHKLLLPITILMGAFIALLCNLLCVIPGENGVLPLNVITPIIGAPIIIYVISKNR